MDMRWLPKNFFFTTEPLVGRVLTNNKNNGKGNNYNNIIHDGK